MTARAFAWGVLHFESNNLGPWYYPYVSRLLELLIVAVIITNVVMVLVSVTEWGFVMFSTVFFALEYIGGVWACAEDTHFGKAGRGAYIVSTAAVLDLTALVRVSIRVWSER